MASVQKVRAYIIYWLQLGKPIIFQDDHQCLPQPIFEGGKTSPAFQNCWQRIMAQPERCYLSGTDESVAELLSDTWEMVDCARCAMPIPLPIRGAKTSPCPCADLPSWPNDEIPQPRSAICSTSHLDQIRQRLTPQSQAERDRLQTILTNSPELPNPTKQHVDAIHEIEQGLIERLEQRFREG